jgi:peptide/nickel transport system substrate-binding protein
MTERTTNWTSRRVSRRTTLRAAGLGTLGLAGSVLIGCGDDDEAADAPAASGGGSSSSAATAAAGSGTSAAASTSNVTEGGTFKWAGTEPNSLDPHLGRGGGDHPYFWMTTQGLVTYDMAFGLQPLLAESWEVADDTTIIFNLRQGVEFSDGNEFTSADVKTSIERVLDPATESTAFAQMSVIESIETPDSHTAIAHLARPSAPILLNLADRGGQIISKSQLADQTTDEIHRGAIGTGPYIVKEWKDGGSVELTANPTYWESDSDGVQYPYVDGLLSTIITDPTVRATSVASGQANVGLIDAANVKLIEDAENADLVIHEARATAHVRINLDLVTDIRVRQAMMWSLDRQAIHEDAYLVKGNIPGISPIGPAHAWAMHTAIQDKVFQDQAESRKLLDAAGLDRVDLGMQASIGPISQQIQAQMAEVGIDIELVQGGGGLTLYHDGLLPLFLTGGFSLRADPDGTIFEVWHGKGFYNAAARRHNGFFSIDPALDRKLEQAQETYVTEERAEFYHQAEEIIVFDAHGVFTGWPNGLWAVNHNVENFVTGGEGKGRFKKIWINA